MQEVIDFILMGIKGGYEILKDFDITVYGFTFSMWDFLVALFILSCIVPFCVSPDSSGSFSNLISLGRGSSERNDDKPERFKAEVVYSPDYEPYHKYREFSKSTSGQKRLTSNKK